MTSSNEPQAADHAVIGRPQPKTTKLGRFARSHALQIGILGVAVVVWIVFFIGSPLTWSHREIYQALMSTTPFFAIMALPLTLVIIAKEIDLSFPSVMSFGMLAFTIVLTATRNVVLALVALLLAGLLAGLLNGLLVARVGIPALVATIGTSFFWRGVVLVSTGGNGSSMVPTKDTFLYPLLVGRLFGRIPMQFVWTIVIAVAVWFFLNRTKYGAHVYLVGDNEDSAKLMGVNVRRTKTIVFCLMGLAAAFTGLVVSMEVLYYWPTLGRRLPAQHAVLGLPGRHFGLWRHRHHLWHPGGVVRYRLHQRRHRRLRAGRLLDAIDLRLDYHRLSLHASHSCGDGWREAWRVRSAESE